MAQHYIMQQEIEQIASQYELGALQKEYDKWNIGVLLALIASMILLLLIPSFWFVMFLIDAFEVSGLWRVACGIIALVACLGIFRIVASFWHIYRKRHSRRLLYTDGFIVVRCQDEQLVATEAIHWRDIATIWRRDVKPNGQSSRVDLYTLQRSNGEIFGKTVQKDVESLLEGLVSCLALGHHIEQMAQPYLWPGVISAYERGEPVTFGPLTVHARGIQYHDNILPWDDIKSFKENKEKRRLFIIPKNGRRFPGSKRVRVVVSYRQIPNFAVFLQLIEYVRGNPPQYPES